MLSFILLMKNFIHDHVEFDELIDDNESIHFEDNKANVQGQGFLKVTKKKEGKPFWLEKHDKEKQEAKQDKFERMKKEIIMRNQKAEQDEYEEYEDDFQEFTESYYESLAKSSRKQSSLRDYHDVNMSAQLPARLKVAPQRYVSEQKHKTEHKKTNKKGKGKHKSLIEGELAKSTLELKRENREMVQKINKIKDLLPIFKNNRKILHSQHEKIRNLKRVGLRAEDYNYLYSLDKAVEETAENQSRLKKLLEKKERKMNKKDHSYIRKKVKAQSPEPQAPERVYIVREQLMCKMREQILHEEKLLELDHKIKQYEDVILEKEQRIIKGSRQLQRNRDLLQSECYSLQNDYQAKACELMTQITHISCELKEVEVKIMQCKKGGPEWKEEERGGQREGEIRKESNPEDLKKTHKNFRVSPRKNQSNNFQKQRMLKLFKRQK